MRRAVVGLVCVAVAAGVFLATRGSSSTSRSAVCSQLVALHRNDFRRDPTNADMTLPPDQPAAAAKKWATYLALQVPKIRDKVLRTFAYDYASTAESGDEETDVGITPSPAALERSSMATYYAHQLCYADTENNAL